MSKTLYVSDLDGTLLRTDQTLSPFTVNTIRELTARGMIFSYATARSWHTALRATPEMAPKLPVIVKNGAHIMETGTGKRLFSAFFAPEDAQQILRVLHAHDINPILYTIEDDAEQNRFCGARISKACRTFLNLNADDPRYMDVPADELCMGDVFYFRCIDDEASLRAAQTALEPEFRTLLFCDMYSGGWWLEIMPQQATKAQAILQLKEMLGCDRVVCFGDGTNDISMFSIADECYAMANAEPELKAIATGVIGHNDEDGVARWLLENFK